MTAMPHEERLRRMRERAKARRERRAAEGKCLECESEAVDGKRCEPHRIRALETAEMWRQTPKAKRTQRKWKKRQYRKRKRQKRCTACGVKIYDGRKQKGPPPEVIPTKCDKCLVEHKVWNQHYLDRRDGLLPPVERVSFDPPPPLPVLEPVSAYQDGEVSLSEAAVRYVELHNGIDARDVGEAFHASEKQCNAISNGLRRAVADGRLLVEGDGPTRIFYPVRHRRAA